MKKYNRPPIPKVLEKRSQQWTTQLLNEIEQCGGYSNVPDSFKEKYRNEEIYDALVHMSKNQCVFCGSYLGISSFINIEHRKPRSKFPQSCYEWNNLFLICDKCNSKKQDKWNNDNPILDLCVDEPEEHIQYSGGMIYPVTPNGTTTIEHTDLNRPQLIIARIKILNNLIRIIDNINNCPDSTICKGSKADLFVFIEETLNFTGFIELMVKRYLK